MNLKEGDIVIFDGKKTQVLWLREYTVVLGNPVYWGTKRDDRIVVPLSSKYLQKGGQRNG